VNFFLLVFSCSGGIGPATAAVYKGVAVVISKKRQSDIILDQMMFITLIFSDVYKRVHHRFNLQDPAIY